MCNSHSFYYILPGPPNSSINPTTLPLPTCALTLPKVTLGSGSTHTVEVKGRGAAHLPERKDIRVLGEGELVLFCVRGQLADDLWGQVTQPAILDTQLIFSPAEAKPRKALFCSSDPRSRKHLYRLPTLLPGHSLALHMRLRARPRCRERNDGNQPKPPSGPQSLGPLAHPRWILFILVPIRGALQSKVASRGAVLGGFVCQVDTG